MADHSTQHNDEHSQAATGEMKSKTAFRSSFWFVIILVGLFIAALNFINVMGNESEGHENHEATATGTLKGETGLGKKAEGSTFENASPAAHDSMQHEAQH